MKVSHHKNYILINRGYIIKKSYVRHPGRNSVTIIRPHVFRELSDIRGELGLLCQYGYNPRWDGHLKRIYIAHFIRSRTFWSPYPIPPTRSFTEDYQEWLWALGIIDSKDTPSPTTPTEPTTTPTTTTPTSIQPMPRVKQTLRYQNKDD
jgi:hypothetical protein